MRCGITAAAATLALSVAVQAAAGDEAHLLGKYVKKIGGDTIQVSLHPVIAKDRRNQVQVFFTYDGPGGENIDFDGIGRMQGNKVTLYYHTYRLNVTLNNGGTADLALEQSCGNHRLYPGYGYYAQHCDPEVANLAPHAKGLRKESPGR